MRFPLTSLFLITALAAVALWGMSQSIYARRIASDASVYLPPVARNEIIVTNLNSNDVVLAIGDDASARVSLIKRYGSVSNIVHSATIHHDRTCLWIQTPKVHSPDKKEFGFAVAGKSYATTAIASEVNVKINKNKTLQKDQSLLLMEVIDSQNSRTPTIYSLEVHAVVQIPR